MRGMGSHARDTPEGLMISTRLVTSKVRHLVSPDSSAAMERRGSARPAAAAVETPMPVFRNVRLSMNPSYGRPAGAREAPPNHKGEPGGVKSYVPIV